MDKIIADFLSVHWWISVVGFGLIINMASEPLKNFIINRFTSLNSSWRKRRENKKEKFNAAVERYMISFEKRITGQFIVIRVMIITVLGLALLIFSFGNYRDDPKGMFALLSLFTALLSCVIFIAGIAAISYMSDVIDTAVERVEEKEKQKAESPSE